MRIFYKKEAQEIVIKHLNRTSDQEIKSIHKINQEELDYVFDKYNKLGICSFTTPKEQRGIHNPHTESNEFLRMKL